MLSPDRRVTRIPFISVQTESLGDALQRRREQNGLRSQLNEQIGNQPPLLRNPDLAFGLEALSPAVTIGRKTGIRTTVYLGQHTIFSYDARRHSPKPKHPHGSRPVIIWDESADHENFPSSLPPDSFPGSGY